MTPDKRLDQVEPVLADVAQKTDRLIESNGQILEVAIRADTNAAIGARGVADLTLKVNQLVEGQIELHQKTDQLTEGQTELNQKTDRLTIGQDELRQEIQKINQKFTQFEQTQHQILTLLLDRLK